MQPDRTSPRGRLARHRPAGTGHAGVMSVTVVLAGLVAGCTGVATSDAPTDSSTDTQVTTPEVASEPTQNPSAPSGTVVPSAGPGEQSSSVADVEMATAMCGWLVAAHTELGEIANEAVAGISAAAPAERMESIMTGYAEAIEVAQGFPADLEDHAFPDIPERDQLVQQVAAGADEAADELGDEREAFAERGSVIADEDVFGGVGQFFNGFEKAMSSLEPSVAVDARPELQAAFLEEESCQFVIQPFPLTE